LLPAHYPPGAIRSTNATNRDRRIEQVSPRISDRMRQVDGGADGESTRPGVHDKPASAGGKLRMASRKSLRGSSLCACV
jgi:hypothetical protein